MDVCIYRGANDTGEDPYLQWLYRFKKKLNFLTLSKLPEKKQNKQTKKNVVLGWFLYSPGLSSSH